MTPEETKKLVAEQMTNTAKAEQVREQLRKLERMVVGLPQDTNDRARAVRIIRSMIGDQISELTWWLHANAQVENQDGSQ